MDFKKEYNEVLQAAGSIGNLSNQCHSFYRDNYANATVSDKVTDILPGKIYTLFYKVANNNENVLNRRPILFVDHDFDVKKGLIMGLDLMLLHPKDRLNFFTRIFKIYEKPIQQNLNRKESTPGAQMPLKINPEILEILFGGINYKHSYTGYNLEHVQRLKEIPIEEWKYLVYLNTKSIEGGSIEEIYKNYR